MQGQDQLPETLSNDIRETTKNIRRRYALYYVTQVGGDVDFEDLVDRIASWETGLPPSEVDASTRKSVYNSLYQTHLPKLEERGLITFNRETKTVSVTHRTEEITLVFRQEAPLLDRWSAVYLIVSGIGLAWFCLWFLNLLSLLYLVHGYLLLLILLMVIVLVRIYIRYQSTTRLESIRAPDYTVEFNNEMMGK